MKMKYRLILLTLNLGMVSYAFRFYGLLEYWVFFPFFPNILDIAFMGIAGVTNIYVLRHSIFDWRLHGEMKK